MAVYGTDLEIARGRYHGSVGFGSGELAVELEA
jgi:hypothetical protein